MMNRWIFAIVAAVGLASASAYAQPVPAGGLRAVQTDTSLDGTGTSLDTLGVRRDCSTNDTIKYDGDSWECTGGPTVTGSGAANRSVLWASSSSIGVGAFYDDGTNAAIGGTFLVSPINQNVPTFSGGLPANLVVTHGSGNFGLAIDRATNDNSGANLTLYKTRSTDPATKVALVNGDLIGNLNFQGPTSSSDVQQGATIRAQVDGVVSAGTLPTALAFMTGTTTGGQTTRLTISSNGGSTFSGTVAANGLLAANGGLSITGSIAANSTSGTSGDVLTMVGVLPKWQSLATSGIVTGTGAANTMTKWTGTGTIGNTLVTENGTTLNYNSGKFVVTASNGNTATAGTLFVGSSSTLTGTTSVATGSGFLAIGDDIATATDAQRGFRINPASDGSVYVDAKTITGGLLRFRTGAGTETGFAHTWLTVTPSTAATLFSGNMTAGNITATGNLTAVDVAATDDLDVTDDATIGDALTVGAGIESTSLFKFNGRNATFDSEPVDLAGTSTFINITRAGTFDTTDSGRSSTGINLVVSSTRSLGTGNLLNRALLIDVTGGQINNAIQTVHGDEYFNTTSGSLGVGYATADTIPTKFSVKGSVTLNDGTGTTHVTGATTLDSTINVAGTASFDGTVIVGNSTSDAHTFNGTIVHNSPGTAATSQYVIRASSAGAIAFTNNGADNQAITFDADYISNWKARDTTVAGIQKFGDKLMFWNVAGTSNGTTITSEVAAAVTDPMAYFDLTTGDFALGNGLDITGNLDIGGDLGVTGSFDAHGFSTFDGSQVDLYSPIVNIGEDDSTELTVGATVEFHAHTAFFGVNSFTGDTEITSLLVGTLVVDTTATFNDETVVNAPLFANSTATFKDDVVIGEDAADSLTVAGPAEFQKSVTLLGATTFGDAQPDAMTFVGMIGVGSNAPGTSSCGTGASVIGDNNAGKVTVGSGVSNSCQINFAWPFTHIPACVATGSSSSGGQQIYISAKSTTSITVNNLGTDIDNFDYVCIDMPN